MSFAPFDSIAIGDELPELALSAVTRTNLALFAGASGDHNPIHIDLDIARKSGMPDVFGQGMLSMAWLCRMLTNWAPQSCLRKVDVRFTGITHLGNAITCRGKVVDLLEVDAERCVRVEISTTNQYGQIKIAGDALIAVSGPLRGT
jgi:acyl dehydratase